MFFQSNLIEKQSKERNCDTSKFYPYNLLVTKLRSSIVLQSNPLYFLSFYRPEDHQIVSRSFSKWKRSIKKFLFAWTFYAPEFGFCSCLFKYAWYTYPIIPEVTVSALGRARRMISGFMYNFWEGYADEQANAQYRISSKVADMTAEDYYDYKNNEVRDGAYGPFRRDGNYANIKPENVPIVEKLNPKLTNVVEMLKNLQPKANASDFVIRLIRHMKSPPNNIHQFHFVNDDGDKIKYHRHDEARDDEIAIRPAINETKVNTVEKGRSAMASNLGPVTKPIVDRIGFDVIPPGLPSFSELPSADYTYYENGVYHHVHDLRHIKGHYPQKKKRNSGGWLSFDFEDAILTALGLSHPGRSVKPSVIKCSKIYAFQAVLRFIQSAFVG